MPDFLSLPEREAKPRACGITHMIDPGLPHREADALMELVGDYVDVVRLGWGTSYVTPNLGRKLEIYRGHGVPVMLGGTLTELAWLQGKVDELRRWLDALAIDRVEVSSGVVRIPPGEKLELIARLARDRTVYAEVGEKDPRALMAPYRWIELIRQSFEAGASWVVCEGRAGGDAGMYRPDGEVRTGLVDEIAHELGIEKLILEAPRRHQQIYLLETFGSAVNLGNVPPDEVLSLETLRLGLRADTLKHFHETP